MREFKIIVIYRLALGCMYNGFSRKRFSYVKASFIYFYWLQEWNYTPKIRSNVPRKIKSCLTNLYFQVHFSNGLYSDKDEHTDHFPFAPRKRMIPLCVCKRVCRRCYECPSKHVVLVVSKLFYGS